MQVHHDVGGAVTVPRVPLHPGGFAGPDPGQLIFEAQRGQHPASVAEVPGCHQQVDVAVVTAARCVPVEAVGHGRAFEDHAADACRIHAPDHLAGCQIQGQGARRQPEVGFHAVILTLPIRVVIA